MKVPTAGEKTADKAVGRTRGGLNTKLHTIVDGLGNPVTFLLSAGNDHDSTHAIQLLEQVNISGSSVLADPIKFRVNDKLRQYEKLRLSQEWE